MSGYLLGSESYSSFEICAVSCPTVCTAILQINIHYFSAADLLKAAVLWLVYGASNKLRRRS